MTVLFNPVPVRWGRLRLAQGDLAAAARWTHQRGLSPDDEPAYPRESEYLVLARLLLGQDRPGRALAPLGRLHAGAARQCRIGSVIEIRALQALALAECGDHPAAVDALIEALALAWPQSYVRAFADEGAPMAALLGRLATAQRAERAARRPVPVDYLARLLRAFDGQHTDSRPGRPRRQRCLV